MDLSQYLGGQTGTWTIPGTNIVLPDYGKTEGLIDQGVLPANSTYQNPSIASSANIISPIPSGATNTNPIGPGYGNYGTGDYYTPTTETQQTTTQSSGPGYAPSFDGQTVGDGTTTWRSENGKWVVQAQQSAQDARNQTLAAIQSRLNAARETASGIRNRAKSSFDYLTDKITTRYPELIKSTEGKQADALTNIDTQTKDTSNAYAKADMQARRIAENNALQTRMNARAGNRLGSSFYNDAIANNKQDLATGLGASDLEKISKMAAYGTQKNETTRYYEDAIKSIQQSRDDAAYQAYQEYQATVAQADQLEKAGVLDYGEGVAQAEQALNSRLSQIDAYANSLATQAQQFDQTYATQQAGVGTYTPDASITDALGRSSGINAATGFTGSVMGAAAPSATAPQFYGKTKPLTLNDILANAGGGGSW